MRLRDLESFFEGVVPSIIATSSSDGTPNVSYLSHVVLVDDEHIGLSNQFFTTTAQNLRENPEAAVLVVDALTGAQCRLGARYEATQFEGPLFDRLSVQLRASSAQIGMSNVMRLRGVDIFAVNSIEMLPAPLDVDVKIPKRESHLEAALELSRILAFSRDFDRALDDTLAWVSKTLECDRVAVFLGPAEADMLTTAATLGYERSAIGSEIRLGEGTVGNAASARCVVKISDMSRARRYNAAISASINDENLSRTISLPSDPATMSQLAAPMVAVGDLQGVLLAESNRRLAFSAVHEQVLELAAHELGKLVALFEAHSQEEQRTENLPTDNRRKSTSVSVTHHGFDDSVFVDGEYMIKGIAGRILVHLLRIHIETGRVEFANRELRLSQALRLPEFKDNLETRLLLLRRRLAEKQAAIQLRPSGRGRFVLEMNGHPVLKTDEA